MVALRSLPADARLVSMQDADTRQTQLSMVALQTSSLPGAGSCAASDPVSIAAPVWSEQCRIGEVFSPTIGVDVSNSSFAVLRFIEKPSAEDTLVKMGLVSPEAPWWQPKGMVRCLPGLEPQPCAPNQGLVQFPPGLEPSPSAPSYGFWLQGRGSCQPCAWFWEKSVCKHGQYCSHYHLCSECEFKARKKSKAASKHRAGMSETEGSVKARRKPMPLVFGERAQSTELAVVRLGLVTPKADVKPSATVEALGLCFGLEPCQAMVSCSESERTVGAGSVHGLAAAQSSEDDLPFAQSAELALVRLGLVTPKADVKSSATVGPPESFFGLSPCRATGSCSESETTVSGGSDHDVTAAQSSEDDLPFANNSPMVVGIVDPLSTSLIQFASKPTGLQRFCQPSEGSTLHDMGSCQPCAWFWKANGCQNSAACKYCHMCTEGEIKRRRKHKLAARRSSMEARRQKTILESLVG